MTQRLKVLSRLLVGIVMLAASLVSPLAQAVYPGVNGQIVYTYNAIGPYHQAYQGDTYLINADGTGNQALSGTSGLFSSKWSPQGDKIAGIVSDGDAYTFSIIVKDLSTNTTATLRQATWATIDSFTWAPDGSSIYFSEKDPVDNYLDLYSVSLRTGQSQRLTYDTTNYRMISAAPTGHRLAFVSNIDGDDEIYVLNLDTDEVDQITINATADTAPSWSPDGAKLMYAGGPSQPSIYTVSADGSASTRLTNDGYCYDYPSWSPDGTKIVAARSEVPSGNCDDADVVVMNSNGTNKIQISQDGNIGNNYTNTMPDWRPLGASINVYRLANPYTKERLFTTSIEERDYIVAHYGWVYETMAFNALSGTKASGVTPVYRLANPYTKERLFTTSAAERDYAVSHYGWVYETIAFYANTSTTGGHLPVYRLANPYTKERLFTTSAAERDYAVAHYGWVYETIAFYTE